MHGISKPAGERFTQAALLQRANIASWITELLNVVIWIIAFRFVAGSVPDAVAWAVVGARVAGAFGLLGSYKPIPAFLDRLAWFSAFFAALFSGAIFPLLGTVGVFALWYLVASMGSNYYARATAGWDVESASPLGNSTIAPQ